MSGLFLSSYPAFVSTGFLQILGKTALKKLRASPTDDLFSTGLSGDGEQNYRVVFFHLFQTQYNPRIL